MSLPKGKSVRDRATSREGSFSRLKLKNCVHKTASPKPNYQKQFDTPMTYIVVRATTLLIESDSNNLVL